MKQILLFGLLYLGFFNKSTGQSAPLKSPMGFILDSSQGPLLLRQCSRATPNHISSYWTISQTDKMNLEANIYKIDSSIATKCCNINDRIKTYKGFIFQYVGVEIRKKKYVYVNAFPVSELEEYRKMSHDISKYPVVVCDGGPDYWGALFDIRTKTFKHFRFNGSL